MEDIITYQTDIPDDNLEFTSSMLIPREHYAFTINPANQWEERTDRIQKIISSTKRKLNSMSFTYYLNWELSNPRRCMDTSRVHFHGYIYWKSYDHLLRWYQNERFELQKQHMFIIKPIDNPEKWLTYICKDREPIEAFSNIMDIETYIQSYNYEPAMHRPTIMPTAKVKSKPSKPTKKA